MPKVVGIDPGTTTIDLFGIDNGRVFLDRAFPAPAVARDPAPVVELVVDSMPLDLVAGPSGYGLPLVRGGDLTDTDLTLALLARQGEPGGIGGLRRILRALVDAGVPLVITPGVVHLESVPRHRKVNRVDMGTADKVAVAVLALQELSARDGCPPSAISCLLLEIGGAFTAGLAIAGGRIVDGVGGTAGPIGLRAAGALDGEVAFLAGTVSKDLLFGGGLEDLTHGQGAIENLEHPQTELQRTAREALFDGLVKLVAMLHVSAPDAGEVVLSGRGARHGWVRDELAARLAPLGAALRLTRLAGSSRRASEAAQGAALLADGLSGGPAAPLVQTLGLRRARGTALDHLVVIPPEQARRRLFG